MSLIEVMVVIVILIAVAAVVVPSAYSLMELEQRKAAKQLALTYQVLHDQAVLQNLTFRVAYHLDSHGYVVEVGSAETLIFDDPKKRAEYEEERNEKLARLSDDDRAAETRDAQFMELQDRFDTRVTLPHGTVFAGAYTPQYEDMVRPGDGSDDQPAIVYSYNFPNGFAEHTMVQLVSAKNPEEGYTVEIEPLSGRVRLHTELVDVRDGYGFVPEDGPDLPQ